MVLKARVVGTINRMPGLYTISGYRPTAYMSPGIIVSPTQMTYMIEKYTDAFPEVKEKYEALMSKQPEGNSHGIPKKSLHINVKEDADRLDRARIKNRLI